jgi:hypothetical protein
MSFFENFFQEFHHKHKGGEGGRGRIKRLSGSTYRQKVAGFHRKKIEFP